MEGLAPMALGFYCNSFDINIKHLNPPIPPYEAIIGFGRFI